MAFGGSLDLRALRACDRFVAVSRLVGGVNTVMRVGRAPWLPIFTLAFPPAGSCTAADPLPATHWPSRTWGQSGLICPTAPEKSRVYSVLFSTGKTQRKYSGGVGYRQAGVGDTEREVASINENQGLRNGLFTSMSAR